MTLQTNSDVVKTCQATSRDEMKGVTRLWREVYGEEFGWLPDNADPYVDGYHERSTYYASWLNGDVPVGTMRIVDALPLGFHITDAVELTGLMKTTTKAVEVQRLMVPNAYRDRRMEGAPFGIYGCMVKACLHHVMRNRVDIILADCHLGIDIGPLKSLKAMGFQETGQTYVDDMNGLDCVILTLETKQWLHNILHAPNAFNRYLMDIEGDKGRNAAVPAKTKTSPEVVAAK